MKKPIIAIDIDDVLAANAAGFVAYSNEKWGTNLKVEDYVEHWAQIWKTEHDIEETTRRRDQFIGSGAHGSFASDRIANVVLKKMSETYELHILTSRMVSMKDDTFSWLAKHYEGIFSEDSIHFAGIWDTLTHNSHTLTKAEVVKTIGADYLIDDQLKHCEAVAVEGVKALLFGDYRWNQTDQLPKNISRVSNWSEVGDFFNEFR